MQFQIVICGLKKTKQSKRVCSQFGEGSWFCSGGLPWGLVIWKETWILRRNIYSGGRDFQADVTATTKVMKET